MHHKVDKVEFCLLIQEKSGPLHCEYQGKTLQCSPKTTHCWCFVYGHVSNRELKESTDPFLPLSI